MSGLFDFKASRQLADLPFDALVFAAIGRADSGNLARLAAAFPSLVAEYRRRYASPGGVLAEDEVRA